MFTNLLQFIFTLITIFIIAFIPGYLILRRWDLKDDERITASFGISFILLYILNFSLFILNESFINLFYLVYAALFLVLICLYRYRIEIVNKFKDSFLALRFHKLEQSLRIEHLHLLILFFILYIYTASFESLIRSLFYFYTTGFTGNDWLGFYNESRFFASKTTVDMAFLLYRTPMYYIVNGFFLRLFGDSFWIYQVGNSILTAPFFLGIYLLSKKLFANEPLFKKIGLITILFVFFNPFFFMNIIYPFSKILAAYFIIMSIYFYLKLRESKFNGKRKTDFLLWGFFSGAAYMSHQLALLYIIGLAMDYLFLIRYKIIKFSIKTAAVSIIPLISIIAPWYIWAIGEYGIKTVLSSSPVFKTTFLFWIYSRLQDIFTSFVPVELIYYIFAAITGISRSFDKLFDSTMSFYYHTIFGAFTISMTAFLFCRIKKDGTKIKTKMNDIFRNLKYFILSTSDHHGFMGILIIAGFVGGVLTVPAFFLAHHGLAMASFVPLISLLMVYLVKYAYSSHPRIRLLLFSGVIAEFLITTWAQLLITNFNLKTLPIPGEKSYSIILNLVSGNVFLGNYWIISLIVVILIQLFFIANFYRLFVKGEDGLAVKFSA